MAENNSILQKLDGLEARFEEISTLITDPSVISDQERYVKLTREYKELSNIMDARKRYIACLNTIREAKDIIANESDPDMREMAREELTTNEALQPKIEEEIKMALVPKDPEDAKNVQMEIRAGTGGDEAALFAGDLFLMYKKFCDSKGWQLSVTSESEGAVGGYKEIDFAVSVWCLEIRVGRSSRATCSCHRDARAHAHQRSHRGSASRSRQVRGAHQRRRDKMGHIPLFGCWRSEREQGGIRSSPALHVEKSQYRRDRRDTHRMY